MWRVLTSSRRAWHREGVGAAAEQNSTARPAAAAAAAQPKKKAGKKKEDLSFLAVSLSVNIFPHGHASHATCRMPSAGKRSPNKAGTSGLQFALRSAAASRLALDVAKADC